MDTIRASCWEVDWLSWNLKGVQNDIVFEVGHIIIPRSEANTERI